MSIDLIIDDREKALIEELRKICELTVRRLDLGDIIFEKDKEVVMIIERKTVSDLKASICDGRAREQKARLLGCGTDICKIMYLIEGNLDKPLTQKISGLPVSTLLGSLINTQLRDNIKVYKTHSIFESAQFLCKLKQKLTKDYSKFFKSAEKMTASKYSASLKKCKKANMTPEVWFLQQLSLIPQVTEKIAEKIIENYNSVVTIINEYARTPEHLKAKLLSDLTYQLSTGKMRRIGDKVSNRIYKFFSGIN